MDKEEGPDPLDHHRPERNQAHNQLLHGGNIDPHYVAHKGPGGGNGYEEKQGKKIIHQGDVTESRDDKSSR